MAVSVGQAIALGTLARPNNDRPLTNFVLRKQQFDLAKKKEEQERANEQRKLQDELSKMLNYGDGGFSPLFQDEVSEITAKSMVRQKDYLDKRDRVGLSSESARLKNDLENKHVEDKAFNAGFDVVVKEGLLPAELANIRYMRKKDAQALYNKEVQKNPAIRRVLDLDEGGNFRVNPASNIDLDKELRTIGSSLEKAQPIIENGKQKTIRIGDTTRTLTQADPNVVAQTAFALTQNPDVVTNVILKRGKDYENAYMQISKDPQHKDKTSHQLQAIAAAEVLRKDLQGYATDHIDIRDRAPSGGSGTGKGFNDTYTVTSTPYTLMTQGAGAPFASAFKDVFIKTQKPEDLRVVAIEPKVKGGDTESFQLSINGKQVRPVNYVVDDKTGKVIMNYSAPKEIGVDKASGKPLYEQTNQSVELNQETFANIAAQYGFGGKDGVERFKKDALGFEEKPSDKKSSESSKPTAYPQSTSKKEIKSSEIGARAKASGYTETEYRKLLQQKGIKIIN